MERVAKIAIKGLGLRLVRKGSGDKGNAVPQSQNFLIILFGTVSNYPTTIQWSYLANEKKSSSTRYLEQICGKGLCYALLVYIPGQRDSPTWARFTCPTLMQSLGLTSLVLQIYILTYMQAGRKTYRVHVSIN